MIVNRELYNKHRVSILHDIKKHYPKCASEAMRALILRKYKVDVSEDTIRGIASRHKITLLPGVREELIARKMALYKLREAEKREEDRLCRQSRNNKRVNYPTELSELEVLALTHKAAQRHPKRENYIDSWPN